MKQQTQAMTNEDARRRGERALWHYLKALGDDPTTCSVFEILALIADLLHVARSDGWNSIDVLEQALGHFEWEVAHEDPEVEREIAGKEQVSAAARARIESDPIRILRN